MNGFHAVDAFELPEEVRSVLRPGEKVRDREGRMHDLPRYFYRIDSWDQAKATNLTPHFTLAELTMVDCREDPRLLRDRPHYVPCAIAVLAMYLEVFRSKVDGPVHISANGGYRSPAHARSALPDSHCWGVAADICRVGSTWLDSEESIAKYGKIAAELPGEVLVKEWGHGVGQADDHLHIDLGYLIVPPREVDEAL